MGHLPAVQPDIQTPSCLISVLHLPLSALVCVRQRALGSLPRKAPAMPAEIGIGICGQVAYKQNGNENRSLNLEINADKKQMRRYRLCLWETEGLPSGCLWLGRKNHHDNTCFAINKCIILYIHMFL